MHRLVTLAATLLLLAPVAAHSQSSPPPDPQPRPASSGSPDFLFGSPHGFAGVRGSWMFASAGSDIFDFVERHLTVEKKDFNAPVFGFDLALIVNPRLELLFGFDLSRSRTESEYRDFVDNQLLPINQQTALTERNAFGSVRFNLLPRGQRVSRFAWVPRTMTPYVGAGGGVLYYNFEQNGDFVDFANLDVFTDYFRSKGYAPSVHVFGGADVKLHRALFLSFEGKYVRARAKLSQDFVDFDPIDLAGFKLSTGINVLF